jgi:hypothetical protein
LRHIVVEADSEGTLTKEKPIGHMLIVDDQDAFRELPVEKLTCA